MPPSPGASVHQGDTNPGPGDKPDRGDYPHREGRLTLCAGQRENHLSKTLKTQNNLTVSGQLGQSKCLNLCPIPINGTKKKCVF